MYRKFDVANAGRKKKFLIDFQCSLVNVLIHQSNTFLYVTNPTGTKTIKIDSIEGKEKTSNEPHWLNRWFYWRFHENFHFVVDEFDRFLDRSVVLKFPEIDELEDNDRIVVEQKVIFLQFSFDTIEILVEIVRRTIEDFHSEKKRKIFSSVFFVPIEFNVQLTTIGSIESDSSLIDAVWFSSIFSLLFWTRRFFGPI